MSVYSTVVYTELEVLVDRVLKCRAWYDEVCALVPTKKDPGLKYLHEGFAFVQRPQPAALPPKETMDEPSNSHYMEDLKREVSEWNTVCYEIAIRVKAPGNIVFQNPNAVMHLLGHVVVNKFIL